MRMAGAPYHLSRTPWRTGRAPLPGEHDEEIYRSERGWSVEALAAARATGLC